MNNLPPTTTPSGFSFGSPAQSNPTGGGFTFGSPAAAKPLFGGTPGSAQSQPAAGGLQFGSGTTSTPAPSGGLTFGGLAATSTPATGGFSFGTQPSAAPATSAPTIGGLFSAQSQATSVAAAGATTTPSLGLFGSSTAVTTAAASAAPTLPTFGAATGNTGFSATNFGSTAPAPSFGSAAPASTFGTSAAAPTFGTSAAAPTFGTSAAAPTFGTSAAAPTFASSAPAPTFGSQPAATTTSAAPLTLTMSTTTTDSKAAGQQMTFTQLEENINKWTLELEELEKVFLNQATQVNAWDKVLLSNGDKIVSLNEAVEKAKAEQDALEQELDFIGAQHTELEDCIVPLETELSKIPQVDIERGQTYQLAETLDYQLKQMSDDLKEVIEHLNEANKFADPNDPMVQIGKILNAHMTSLQWIDSTTNTISQKLEEIQKMHDTIRKDNERSFRLTYYDS